MKSTLSPRRIGLIVDHPKRDLAGAVMLARALVDRGLEAALIPLYDQGVDVPLLGLNGLVTNFAREVNRPLVESYAKAGIPVWVLDTEGGTLGETGANSPATLARYVRDSGYANMLAGYFFWGSVLHEAFVEGSGMPADRLHVTGCPRFDFASPQWRGTLEYPRSGYLLINANFSLVNPRFSKSPEHEVEALVANGWDGDYVRNLMRDMRDVLAEFVATTRELAIRFPEHQLLLRPHPFENLDYYQRTLGDLPNLVIDGSGSVLNVIAHSDAVIQLNCGTAIEAVMLDRLPLSLEFLNRDSTRNHATLPARASYPVESQDALFAAIRDLPAMSSAFDFGERHTAVIRPWYHKNDGKAADRIADVLSAAVAASPKAPAPSIARSLRSSRLDSSKIQRGQAALANLLGSKLVARLRATFQKKRRDKRLQASEAAAIASLLEKAGAPPLLVRHARHPLTSAPLSTLLVSVKH